ncbi:MAG: hypothetical protein K8W52_01100 [Deltaproteobacteria bacterium]|nr:hypothetical protein [Deltaproteobacteria bacterium]
MRNLPIVASLFAALVLSACGVGEITGPGPGPGGNGGDGPDARPATSPGPDAQQSFAVAVTSPTTATTLGTEVHYTATISSTNFAGLVALNPTGAPASWTVTVEPAQLQVPLDGSITADIKVVIPSDTPDLTGTIGVSAFGTPGTQTASGPALTVTNRYDITIAAGTAAGDHHLPPRVELRLGATLRVIDADATAGVAHRVHSDSGGSGFPHQDADMASGDHYDVTPTETGSFKWYCHIHGQAQNGDNSNLVIK